MKMDESLTKAVLFLQAERSPDVRVDVLNSSGRVLMKASSEKAISFMDGTHRWMGIGKGKQKNPRVFMIQQLAPVTRLSEASVTTRGRDSAIEHHPRTREWHRDVAADKPRLAEQGGIT